MGLIVRSAGVKYANEQDFISGEGAAINGGRWNPIGLKAIYGSLHPVTAVRESYKEFDDYGFGGSMQPRVFAGATVRVSQLLDLCNVGIRRRIGFTLTELLDEDWEAIQDTGEESWTQAIARGAAGCGFEGLRAPSARDRRNDVNIVVFPDYFRTGSTAILVNRSQLPPHPDSWK